MKLKHLLGFPAQMFDLDGTLADGINFPKDIVLLKNYLKLHLGGLELKRGAPEFLYALRAHENKLGLITNCPDKLFAKYQKINPAPYPKLGETFDSVKLTRGAPKTDAILETLDEWKIAPHSGIYYGDTVSDALAAHDAGVTFCHVGAPKRKTLREIQKIGAFFQLDNFNEAVGTTRPQPSR